MFNVVGGWWPLLHMRSFEAVLGPNGPLARSHGGRSNDYQRLLPAVAADDNRELRQSRRIGISTGATLSRIELISGSTRRISRCAWLMPSSRWVGSCCGPEAGRERYPGEHRHIRFAGDPVRHAGPGRGRIRSCVGASIASRRPRGRRTGDLGDVADTVHGVVSTGGRFAFSSPGPAVFRQPADRPRSIRYAAKPPRPGNCSSTRDERSSDAWHHRQSDRRILPRLSGTIGSSGTSGVRTRLPATRV